MNWLVNKGYVVTKSEQNVMVAEGAAGGVANFLYGSAAQPNTFFRRTYNLIPQQESTRVVLDLVLVSNKGTHAERATPLAGEAAKAAQQTLEQMKTELESKK